LFPVLPSDAGFSAMTGVVLIYWAAIAFAVGYSFGIGLGLAYRHKNGFCHVDDAGVCLKI
jgi:hypothetical protein